MTMPGVYISVPTPSADGRYYGRYPAGNAPVTPSGAHLSGSAADGDFASGTLTTSSTSVAVNSSGLMVNATGTPIELRGANMFGLEGQLLVSSWFTANNPWGSLSGPGGPSWPAYASGQPNAVRIPLSPTIFFNLAMGVLTGGSPTAAAWSGTTVAADPNGVMKPAIIAAIQGARAAGCTAIIFDVHWSAPKFTLGGVTNYMGPIDQPAFLNYDTDYPFWTAGVGAGPTDASGSATTGFVAWLQQEFGPSGTYNNPLYGGSTGINDIVFELFNEPYFDQMGCNYNTAYNGTGTTLTRYQAMKSGGWCSSFRNQNDNATLRGGIGCPNAYNGAVGTGQTNITSVDAFGFNYWWRVAGYQSVVNGIRALGATNVILINGEMFAHTQSTLNQVFPTDSMSPSQLGSGMHVYQSQDQTIYPNVEGGSTGASNWDQYVNKTIAGTGGIGFAIPVVLTEFGGTVGGNIGSGPSAAQPYPYMTNMQTWLDSKTTGQVGGTDWAWNNTRVHGFTGQTSWADTVFGAPISITAFSSGTTLTVTAGSGLAVGMSISGGSIDRAYIAALGTGTGGTGTYTLSYSVTQASTTMTAAAVLPLNGQGETNFNWRNGHALP